MTRPTATAREESDTALRSIKHPRTVKAIAQHGPFVYVQLALSSCVCLHFKGATRKIRIFCLEYAVGYKFQTGVCFEKATLYLKTFTASSVNLNIHHKRSMFCYSLHAFCSLFRIFPPYSYVLSAPGEGHTARVALIAKL